MGTVRLPEHSHCGYCGDPIPYGEEYCCDDCRENEKARVAHEKKRDYMFFGIAAATIVILFVIRALTR